MIRQNSLSTVQPSSEQKNKNKENQYQMQRGPLSSATHTKTKQQQQASIQTEQSNETKTWKDKSKWNRKEKSKQNNAWKLLFYISAVNQNCQSIGDLTWYTSDILFGWRLPLCCNNFCCSYRSRRICASLKRMEETDPSTIVCYRNIKIDTVSR